MGKQNWSLNNVLSGYIIYPGQKLAPRIQVLNNVLSGYIRYPGQKLAPRIQVIYNLDRSQREGQTVCSTFTLFLFKYVVRLNIKDRLPRNEPKLRLTRQQLQYERIIAPSGKIRPNNSQPSWQRCGHSHLYIDALHLYVISEFGGLTRTIQRNLTRCAHAHQSSQKHMKTVPMIQNQIYLALKNDQQSIFKEA